jgi:hypothetical protein
MESQLKKLPNNYVSTALAMVGINAKENVAGLIQDTIHSLIEMGGDFDLETASKLVVKHQFEPDNKLVELKAQYRVLSELHDPKSTHRTHRKMGKMLEETLNEIESYTKS